MSDRMPEDLPVRKCINVMVGITRSKVILWLRALRHSAVNCFHATLVANSIQHVFFFTSKTQTTFHALLHSSQTVQSTEPMNAKKLKDHNSGSHYILRLSYFGCDSKHIV
jgi:hypothetical protein